MTRLLSPADYITTPWKSGRGTTTEVARDAGSGFEFGWRISTAPVIEDGPFSAFAGITRSIAVIEGAGLQLSFADGRAHRLLPFAPFTFDGGKPPDARLIDGPSRDFNVMVRRGEWRAELEVLRQADGQRLGPVTGGAALLHIVSGRWRADSELPPQLR